MKDKLDTSKKYRPPVKGGPISEIEKAYIFENHKKLSYRQIANKLGRNPNTINKYIKNELESSPVIDVNNIAEIENELKQSPVWEQIKSQFDSREIKLFLWHWTRIISQFREDIFPTEEIALIHAIKSELLANRLLKEYQTCVLQLTELEGDINKLQFKQDKTEEDYSKLESLRSQQSFLRSAVGSLLKEVNEQTGSISRILKDLKGTRQQRIKEIESSKTTFSGFVKQIIKDKQFRKQLGIDMEKFRHAMNVEFERLSDWHSYADGSLDNPILNEDTMKRLDKLNKKGKKNESVDDKE